MLYLVIWADNGLSNLTVLTRQLTFLTRGNLLGQLTHLTSDLTRGTLTRAQVNTLIHGVQAHGEGGPRNADCARAEYEAQRANKTHAKSWL